MKKFALFLCLLMLFGCAGGGSGDSYSPESTVVPQEPEIPNNPNDPEEPEIPNNPNDPEEPEIPNNPNDPEEPQIQFITDTFAGVGFSADGLSTPRRRHIETGYQYSLIGKFIGARTTGFRYNGDSIVFHGTDPYGIISYQNKEFNYPENFVEYEDRIEYTTTHTAENIDRVNLFTEFGFSSPERRYSGNIIATDKLILYGKKNGLRYADFGVWQGAYSYDGVVNHASGSYPMETTEYDKQVFASRNNNSYIRRDHQIYPSEYVAGKNDTFIGKAYGFLYRDEYTKDISGTTSLNVDTTNGFNANMIIDLDDFYKVTISGIQEGPYNYNGSNFYAYDGRFLASGNITLEANANNADTALIGPSGEFSLSGEFYGEDNQPTEATGVFTYTVPDTDPSHHVGTDISAAHYIDTGFKVSFGVVKQ